ISRTEPQAATRMPSRIPKRSHQRHPEKNSSHAARNRKVSITVNEVLFTRCMNSRLCAGHSQMQATATQATHRMTHGNQKRKNVRRAPDLVVSTADMVR